MVQWFCAEHFPGALSRLAGLLRAVQTIRPARAKAA
jgi:hypothetical protein